MESHSKVTMKWCLVAWSGIKLTNSRDITMQTPDIIFTVCPSAYIQLTLSHILLSAHVVQPAFTVCWYAKPLPGGSRGPPPPRLAGIHDRPQPCLDASVRIVSVGRGSWKGFLLLGRGLNPPLNCLRRLGGIIGIFMCIVCWKGAVELK